MVRPLLLDQAEHVQIFQLIELIELVQLIQPARSSSKRNSPCSA
ncbi:hypothetical protein [Streptomyces sp. NPDC058657]